jgi:hypothetical protein
VKETYEASNTNLRTGVAELCERSVEQAVLFFERFDIGVCVRLCGLESHVCIGYFRNRCKVKYDSEREHEARNRQVNPLNILKRLLIIADMVEDSVGSNDRCHDRSDSVVGCEVSNIVLGSPTRQRLPQPQNSPIKSLRKINPNLRILRRPTNRNIRISRRLQTPQPIPNNENRRAETPKTPVQNARPGYERSDAVQA